MKKRFLSLVLALSVACSLTVPTWAAGTDWNDALGDLAGSGNETLYILMILNSATDAKNGVVTSEDGSDVETWQKWVTPKVMADFQQKLDTAYAYYLDNAGSNEAALAALALQEAITPFKNAQQYGYKSDSSVTPEPEPDPEPEPEPEPETPFSDVTENDWYYAFVATVYAKSLFAGFDDGTFRPQENMTYGQFLAVLSQFSGASINTQGAAVWYDPYVQWGMESGSLPGALWEGFDPTAPVTRQDMAVMFGLFLEKFQVNYSIVNEGTPAFTDSADIASYASSRVTTCWQAGIMGGRPDGSFDPQSTATRAEVAVTMCQMARVMGR